MIRELDELAAAKRQPVTKPSGPGGGGGSAHGGLGRAPGSGGGIVKAGGALVRSLGPQIVLTAFMWYLGKKAAASEARRVRQMLEALSPELGARVSALEGSRRGLALERPFLPIHANVKLRWDYSTMGGVANQRHATRNIAILDVEVSHHERSGTRRVDNDTDHVWHTVPVAPLDPVHAQLSSRFAEVAGRYGRDTAEAIAVVLLRGMHAESVVNASHWGSGPTEEGGLEEKRHYVEAYIQLSKAHSVFAQFEAAASSFLARLAEEEQPGPDTSWWKRGPQADESFGPESRAAVIEYIENLDR